MAAGGLGFGEQAVGFLQSIVYAATYVLPILGGALADRYGYRRMLLVAFSLLACRLLRRRLRVDLRRWCSSRSW